MFAPHFSGRGNRPSRFFLEPLPAFESESTIDIAAAHFYHPVETGRRTS